MSTYNVEVRVTPRAGLLDPQGKAVNGALHSLAFAQVDDVRVGRLIKLKVNAASDAEARELTERMCKQLLANPVTEDYEISVSA